MKSSQTAYLFVISEHIFLVISSSKNRNLKSTSERIESQMQNHVCRKLLFTVAKVAEKHLSNLKINYS